MTSRLRAWPFALAAAGLAAGFVAVYLFFVRTYVGQIVDERAFNGAGQQHLAFVTVAVHLLGVVPEVAIGAGILLTVIIGVVTRRPKQLLVGIAVGAVACALAELSKYVFLSRPEIGATDAFNNSFPSGHATVVSSAAFAVFVVSTPKWRPVVAVLGGAFAIATGVLLVMAQWHRPSDVVAAFLLVATCGCLGGAALVTWHVPAAPRPAASLRPLRWVAGIAAAVSLAAFITIYVTVQEHGSHLEIASLGGGAAILATGCGLVVAGNRLFRDIS